MPEPACCPEVMNLNKVKPNAVSPNSASSGPADQDVASQDAGSLDAIKQYYGKTLRDKAGLQTKACCCAESIPAAHRAILAEIDEEILNRFYGCGSPLPPALEGCTVLDLGCGSGRDVYMASRLVGPEGFVIGVLAGRSPTSISGRAIWKTWPRWALATTRSMSSSPTA